MQNVLRMSVLTALLASSGVWACDLKVQSAWIREAPGTATMLAGYAVLSNVGSKPLTLVSLRSAAFAQVEMHESTTDKGIAKMRDVDQLQIPAQGKVEFSPSGKHFMLVQPKNPLRGGDAVIVKFKDDRGCETTANFKVMRDAPGMGMGMDQSKMDHSKMDHSKMDHSMMDHSKMDHSKSDHEASSSMDHSH